MGEVDFNMIYIFNTYIFLFFLVSSPFIFTKFYFFVRYIMKFVVVGYKKIERKSDKVNFIELNCERDDKVDEGVGVEKFFIRADNVENLDSLIIGSELKCYYNQFGRIDTIEIK